MNAVGKIIAGMGTFTHLAAAKSVQIKTKVAGEMKSVNLLATGSGNQLFLSICNSEAMSYGQKLKIFVLSIRPDSCTSADGSLALVGTG